MWFYDHDNNSINCICLIFTAETFTGCYMRKILALLFLSLSFQVNAQNDLFGLEKQPARKGFILGFNGGVDFPGGDMAERYGTSWRVGGQVLYKTKSNWVFGPKFDYMFGNNLREDSLLSNIVDKYGTFISSSGERVTVNFYQRGYMFGLQGGRIFNISKKNSDNGILAMTTIGFMEHKLFIRDRDNSVPALRGDYIKGYDRLTSGLVLEQYIGYTYFANNNLLNFHIGLNVTAGFTQGRRDWLYDRNKPGTESRFDLLFGIRGGWYIPIFRRKSEEFFFE